MPKRQDDFWASKRDKLRYCSKHRRYYKAKEGCRSCTAEKLTLDTYLGWLDDQMKDGSRGKD